MRGHVKSAALADGLAPGAFFDARLTRRETTGEAFAVEPGAPRPSARHKSCLGAFSAGAPGACTGDANADRPETRAREVTGEARARRRGREKSGKTVSRRRRTVMSVTL